MDDDRVFQPANEFWEEYNEVKRLQQQDSPDGSKDSLLDNSSSSTAQEENEAELTWLKRCGFSDLAARYESGNEIDENLLSMATESLTKKQYEAVLRRVIPLNSTLRRVRHTGRLDVRNIFQPQQNGSKDSPDSRSPPDPPRKIPSVKLLRNRSRSYRISVAEASKTAPTPGKVRLSKMRSTAEVASSVPSSMEVDTLTRGDLRKSVSDENLLVNNMELSEESSVDQLELDIGPSNNLNLSHTSQDPSLPTVQLCPDDTGLTYLEDLAIREVPRILSIAHMELSTIFDNADIEFTPPKIKKRGKDQGLFGNDLTKMVDFERKTQPNAMVPIFVRKAVAYIRDHGMGETGIFRMQGSASRIQTIRKELETQYKHGSVDLMRLSTTFSPHDVATMLKQFLRELFPPLLTCKYTEAFTLTEGLELKDQLRALTMLFILLPAVHRKTLRIFLELFRDIGLQHETNNMTLENLSMIIAPNLFVPASFMGKKRRKDSLRAENELQFVKQTITVVRKVINYQEILWLVPSAMVYQLREKNENHPEFRKKIRKGHWIDKRSVVSAEPVVKIFAPALKFEVTLKLHRDLQVEDIILRHFNRSDCARLSLFEVGGNIEQRRLHLKAYMYAIYRANPNTRFIAKIC